MVTPLSRRRVQKLARETVTLDHLSEGRLTLGVGLGSTRNNELEPFGEVVDTRERARLLDEGLDRLNAFWGGEFEPLPVQRPRIPVWVAARLAESAAGAPRGALGRPVPDRTARTGSARGAGERGPRVAARGGGGFDLVVEIQPGGDPGPWEAAGATWVLTSFGPQPREADVRATIEAGPNP